MALKSLSKALVGGVSGSRESPLPHHPLEYLCLGSPSLLTFLLKFPPHVLLPTPKGEAQVGVCSFVHSLAHSFNTPEPLAVRSSVPSCPQGAQVWEAGSAGLCGKDSTRERDADGGQGSESAGRPLPSGRFHRAERAVQGTSRSTVMGQLAPGHRGVSGSSRLRK